MMSQMFGCCGRRTIDSSQLANWEHERRLESDSRRLFVNRWCILGLKRRFSVFSVSNASDAPSSLTFHLFLPSMLQISREVSTSTFCCLCCDVIRFGQTDADSILIHRFIFLNRVNLSTRFLLLLGF